MLELPSSRVRLSAWKRRDSEDERGGLWEEAMWSLGLFVAVAVIICLLALIGPH